MRDSISVIELRVFGEECKRTVWVEIALVAELKDERDQNQTGGRVGISTA